MLPHLWLLLETWVEQAWLVHRAERLSRPRAILVHVVGIGTRWVGMGRHGMLAWSSVVLLHGVLSGALESLFSLILTAHLRLTIKLWRNLLRRHLGHLQVIIRNHVKDLQDSADCSRVEAVVLNTAAASRDQPIPMDRTSTTNARTGTIVDFIANAVTIAFSLN